MKTNRALISFGLSVALLLLWNTRQAMALDSSFEGELCAGEGIGAGPLPPTGSTNSISESAVTGSVAGKGKGSTCYTLQGRSTINTSDGKSYTVTWHGVVDGSGGCDSFDSIELTDNGNPSNAGQGFTLYDTGQGTPWDGCYQRFTISSYQKLSGSATLLTGPLTGPCAAAGSTGITLCSGYKQ